ncbi:MAG: hypothetical protein P8J37_09275 [Fuerstiella sp.]|nr:hypothetical protein [Fuerstiella sp.]
MKYASSITEAAASGQMVHVNDAILQQKKFWRFCGILTSIILGIYAVIFIVAILAALT